LFEEEAFRATALFQQYENDFTKMESKDIFGYVKKLLSDLE